MIHFPHNSLVRPALRWANPLANMRQRLTRDVLWNQPLFKAPALPNPAIALEPLPFTATRLTHARRA